MKAHDRTLIGRQDIIQKHLSSLAPKSKTQDRRKATKRRQRHIATALLVVAAYVVFFRSSLFGYQVATSSGYNGGLVQV